MEGTAPTRSGAFSYPRVGREVRPIYIIRWSGAVGGNAVVVVFHSLMLQGDGNDISSPSMMVRTLGNSVGVAFSRRRYSQQDNCKKWEGENHKIENNAYG